MGLGEWLWTLFNETLIWGQWGDLDSWCDWLTVRYHQVSILWLQCVCKICCDFSASKICRKNTLHSPPNSSVCIITRRSGDANIARHVSRCTQRLLPPKCKTPYFSIPSRIWDYRITWPWSNSHAGSQDTDIFYQVPISSFCCTIWSQFTITDRQTNRRT